jgi:hypothetical protein
MATEDMTDQQFVTEMLRRIGEGGGMIGLRAARIAMERRVANQEYESCSVAFPCHHCAMCERELTR